MKRAQKQVFLAGCVLFLCLVIWAGATWAGTVQYTYDARNQVTRAEYGNGNVIAYTYDGIGNRVTMTRIGRSDFGDLPAAYGITTLADDGARHEIPETGLIHLGVAIDHDTDGLESAAADGDDTTGASPDDEDGIVVTPSVDWFEGVNGGSVDVTVTGGSGYLSGWVDWAGNDHFSDPGDQVLDMKAVSAGAHTITFPIPADALPTPGATTRFARFRLDDDNSAAMTPTGLVTNGEVEDYLLALTVVNGRTLTYYGSSFEESPVNDGSLLTRIPIVLSGNTFTGENGDNFAGSTVSAANVPAGLTLIVERLSDTRVEARLTGNATNHGDADDVSTLTISFQDSAFFSGNAAGVTNVQRSDLVVDFHDQPAGTVTPIGVWGMSSPLAADFDRDGDQELVVTAGLDVILLDADGSLLTTYTSGHGQFGASPLLADVNNDGTPEVVALDTTGYVHCLEVSASPWSLSSLSGYPFQDVALTNVTRLGTPAIGDIDGNGTFDLAWAGDNTSGTAFLAAYDLSTQSPVFSTVTLSTNVGTGTVYPRTTAVALANLDTDPGKELVVGYNDVSANQGMVAQVDHDGSLTRTYSMTVGEQIGTGTAPPVDLVASAPTLGDIYGHDGVFEIVIGGDRGTVYIWDTADGSAHHVTPGGSQPISAAPALSDLNDDGWLDVIVADASGQVSVLYDNGGSYALLWTANIGHAPVTAPTVGDVDGDDQLEVVLARMRSGKIVVFNADGSPVAITAGTAGQISAPPAIGDVDRDGDYEIAAVDETSLYLWHPSTAIPQSIIVGFPFDRANIYRDGAVPNIHLYPIQTTEHSYVPPIYSFKLVLENRGTGTAYQVVVRYAGYEDDTYVVMADRTANAGTIGPGEQVTTTDSMAFDLTNYDGRPVMFYFDITYEDASGSEYLIHR